MVICFANVKKCGQVYPRESKHEIGNLKRHLANCKKRNFKDIGQLLLKSRSGSLGNRRPDFDPEVFRTMIATCIVKHDLPLQFCEYDGVRGLFCYLNPDVKVFTWKTTKHDVVKLFACEKEKMKLFLQSFSGRVSFTTDCWTSISTDSYISLNAHYIDDNWMLRKKNLKLFLLASSL